jgi:transcription elongation factor Elf1
MTIPNHLSDVALTFECPYCGHPIVRKGSWFKSIAHFKCENCHRNVHFGYPDKLALFDHYSRLAGSPGTDTRG